MPSGPPGPLTVLAGLLLALLVAAVGLVVVAGGAGRDDAGPRAGVFRHTSLEDVRAFEAWSGQDLVLVVDYSSREDWRDVARPDYLLAEWAGSGLRPVYAVPMVPEEVPATMTAGARGEYDAHFRTLAEGLVAAGQQDAILRVGWEFNLDSSPYRTDPETFRTYFRRIVAAMRSVPGQELEFDWTVNNGPSGVDATPYYPGDDVVDYVGVDTYDVAPVVYPYPEDCSAACRRARQEAGWRFVLDGDRGLRHWSDFAAARGKPMSVPEWGVWERRDGAGGGDNPVFVRRMHEFLHDERNSVAYHAYFESDNDDVGPHRLMVGFPEAARAYRELFGG